jgi:branched-chain amino acid transport system substrate-binding protein
MSAASLGARRRSVGSNAQGDSTMDQGDGFERDTSRITRRRMLLGTAGAIGAAAFLNACGDDDDGASGGAETTAGAAATTAGGAVTTAGAATTTAPSSGGGGGGGGGDLATQLGIEEASAGKGKTIDLGAVLALSGTGSYYGKTMTRGLDLGAKHIAELGGPTFNYVYLDHKSGDPAAGVQAMAELIAKGVQAKFASYGDDIGAMLNQTQENKMFTLDGGGGTGIFAQGKPFFWGTRAITPNDTLPGVFRWFKENYPDKKKVGLMGWDAGAEINEITKKDILQKIADAGLEFNGLYELVPIGGQDFSQVLPKIKANEPDLLLTGHYGQDPGSFSNQAATAGLKALRMGFEFTPDGLNASKGTYDSEGYIFSYDYFDPKSQKSLLAKKFVEDFNQVNGEDPDFYAANFYENAFVMWEVMRRIWKDDPDAKITGEALDKALQTDLTVISVYGGDEQTPGSYTLDPKTHSVIKREMGVFEYKAGKITPLAFFNIGGADYRAA